MSAATPTEPRVVSVKVTDDAMVACLVDGRVISIPLEWSWRLKEATPQQWKHREIIGDGQGVRWPEVDEDISVEGMLGGEPARQFSGSQSRRGLWGPNRKSARLPVMKHPGERHGAGETSPGEVDDRVGHKLPALECGSQDAVGEVARDGRNERQGSASRRG
jgi:hypothetical protein